MGMIPPNLQAPRAQIRRHLSGAPQQRRTGPRNGDGDAGAQVPQAFEKLPLILS